LQQLLEGHSQEICTLGIAARDLVLQVAPRCHQEVELGWGGYLLFKQGPETPTVCWLTLNKKHVSLGFSQAQALTDPKGLLEGKGKNSRHLKLRTLESLANPDVVSLLKECWAQQPSAEEQSQHLARLRQICSEWPDVSEKLSHGHPTFFSGKRSFAVYGIYSPSVAFKVAATEAMDLAEDPRFFPTPYMAKSGWWSLRLDGETDWEELRTRVGASRDLARGGR